MRPVLTVKIKTLSIIIPCYNEKETIQKILKEIKSVNLGEIKKEIIIVDDCSNDGTRKILAELGDDYEVLLQDVNQGKGAALKRGFLASTGDVIVVQDADLEYDPQDYIKLLYPIQRGHADVVFGSRFVGGEPHRVIYYSHTIANKSLTMLSNIFTGLNLTDMETCYKMMTREVLDKIVPKLEAKRFGFEPEVTARIAKLGARVYEVGIAYYGRTKEEGKKIGFRDGVKALGEIVRYNLFSR